MKKEFIGTVEYDEEDSGCALIAQIDGEDRSDIGMFVRIQSWDEGCEHTEARQFEGKKVKVTIEVI